MQRPFSPREFLKSRRPERFSDSIIEQGSTLDRSLLEYHLETLTSRGQEAEFQRFAFELAKREVCPNLLPQTGPTGGGDSKVDTETYPVADSLSLVWCSGIGREASAERWGFAISAMKKWLPKLKSDIAKIAGTQRGYVKAFFVTNQFVPDKRRAAIEDGLRNKHSMDVRILDRSWILDRVFDGHHESLAIDKLGLLTSIRPQVRQGPQDLEKQQELATIEQRIKDATQENELGYELVADCMEAAILARGLERPRTELDGLFERAERIAKAHGTQHQRLKAAYDRAWTAYWWYEDYNSFAELYESAQEFARGGQNAYDLELLSNLWRCLHVITKRGELDDSVARLQGRTDLLKEELDRLTKLEDRPSIALQAHSLHVNVRLQQALYENGDTGRLLREYREIIQRCEGLVGFPLEPHVQIVAEMGVVVGDQPAYDELFESLTEIASRRKGDVVAARMLLTRGAQQLEAGCPYDAIRSLGRALRRLFTHESRQDIVRALYILGCAYERVSLLWAARGSLLSAASIATSEFWVYGHITALQAACLDQMKWLELQLGRLSPSLAWHEAGQGINSQLVKEGLDEKKLQDREMQFDGILGMLLLKSDLYQLEQLTSLPDVLDNLGLLLAADALRFALGYKVDVPQEVAGGCTGMEAAYRFFSLYREQPAFRDLPERPTLYTEDTVALCSAILGCRISIESDNSSPCIELGESMLAALESLIATGLVDGLIGREPVLTVAIKKAASETDLFTFEVRERAGRYHVEILCGQFDPHSLTVSMQQRIKDRLFELLSHILARIAFLGDVESALTKLIRDDRAIERAVYFTSSFVTLGNVLGHSDLLPKKWSKWYESL
jgi:hypothetical protein